MKVIGGRAKGKKIYLPKGGRLRATSDRIKESLFNILPLVEGKSFLDLYAGTGNIGIEAVSRGAIKTVFIEEHPLMINAITRNLERCGFSAGCEILRIKVESGIRILAKKKEQFDIIFADPPYMKDCVEQTLHILSGVSLISEGGIVVIEHSFRETSRETDTIILTDQRKYGDTMLSFFGLK